MRRFDSYANRLTWSAAFVLTAFLAGCGGGDDGGGGGVGGGQQAPTVVSTTPADAATNVCVNQAPNATFSQAMNPASISATSFTLTDPAGAPVPGAVAMDSANKVATFTPSADLLPTTTYKATINGGASGATNSSGQALAANKTWTFTTDDGTCKVQTPVALGAASTFGAASGVAINNTGTLTKITGDAGAASPASITGLHDSTGAAYNEVAGTNVGEVSGIIYTDTAPDNGAKFASVRSDVTTAFNELVARGGGTDPSNGTGGELGGLTLPPGVYLADSFKVTTGDLTLDAQGDPNAVWVFQCSGAGPGPVIGDNTAPRNVTLVGGAQAKNVYWASNGSATINAVGGGTVAGTIIALESVTVSSGATLTSANSPVTIINGRVFAFRNPITMTNAQITTPAQ